jgi:hypothetical protein
VLLPYVEVFVESLPADHGRVEESADHADAELGHAALKRALGAELVEYILRTCFFGRDKGFAEDRVQLHEENAHVPAMHSINANIPFSTCSPTSHLSKQAARSAEAMLRAG